MDFVDVFVDALVMQQAMEEVMPGVFHYCTDEASCNYPVPREREGMGRRRGEREGMGRRGGEQRGGLWEGRWKGRGQNRTRQ